MPHLGSGSLKHAPAPQRKKRITHKGLILFLVPIQADVVAHSPTPSIQRITAFLNGTVTLMPFIFSSLTSEIIFLRSFSLSFLKLGKNF